MSRLVRVGGTLTVACGYFQTSQLVLLDSRWCSLSFHCVLRICLRTRRRENRDPVHEGSLGEGSSRKLG